MRPMVATLNQTFQTALGKWHRRKGEILRPDAFGPDELDELRTNSLSPDFEMLYQQGSEAAA